MTPKACVKLYQLFEEAKFEEAMRLQSKLAEGDWVHTAAGIGATKAMLQQFFNYGGAPRSPLKLPSSSDTEGMAMDMKDLIAIENSL